jgi:hypothetical protein
MPSLGVAPRVANGREPTAPGGRQHAACACSRGPPADRVSLARYGVLELERQLGRLPEFQAVARYAQFMVRRTSTPEHGT